jgi:(S)-3,5-dihydroxyphenylglycine transaminase
MRRLDAALRKVDLHASVSDPALDAMNFLNEVTSRYPEAISFAPGRPYDGFFDIEQIFTHINRYLRHLADSGQSPSQIRDALFQYGPTGGRIRGLVADSLRQDEGIDVAPEAVVVTVGCQEAMLLTVRALIAGPQDVLLVSSPCYVGITGAARVLDVEVAAVDRSGDDFDCGSFEAVVRAERARGRRPRALYVIPDHCNPLGSTMSLQTRHDLLDLAADLGVLILEDSPYRLVSSGTRLPTLKALDRGYGVVHLGSFSKSLFPGTRVGYAVADQPLAGPDGESGLLADELIKIKSMVTVNTSPLSQAVVAGMLLAAGGRAADLNVETSAYYADTMRATLRQLGECFPAERREALGVRWNEPSGGFFLAVSVPFPADNAALARSARDFGVLWTPMSYFYPQGGGTHAIRLSTSYLSQDDIVDGIGRFAKFVEAEAGTYVDTTMQ